MENQLLKIFHVSFVLICLASSCCIVAAQTPVEAEPSKTQKLPFIGQWEVVSQVSCVRFAPS